MAKFRPLLAAHGVTEQQWRVLRVLGEESPLDATALAGRANILQPSLSRIIRSLVDAGLIARERNEADGRRLVLSITGKGEGLISEVVPESDRIHAGIETKLGKARTKELLDMLEWLTTS